MTPIGLLLPIEKGRRGYYNVSDDLLTQIKSNFINLISTVKGERLNNPEFGCDIHNVIFDPLDDTIYDRAREAIESAIERWMPFLEIEQFEILTDDNDINRNTMRLYVKYRIVGTPSLTDEVSLTL